MPLRQYVYFGLFSEHTSAQEIAGLVGVEADEVGVRGSSSTEAVVRPRFHRWNVVCREPELGVDEQIARVVGRLTSCEERIGVLVRRLEREEGGGGGGVLQVVRYFNDDDETTPEANLFGWHLNRGVMDFLSATGAELDIDEYDLS